MGKGQGAKGKGVEYLRSARKEKGRKGMKKHDDGSWRGLLLEIVDGRGGGAAR